MLIIKTCFLVVLALKEDPSKLEKVTNIECLEIIDVVNNKDLVLAFNFLDMEDNMKQVTNFENFLLSQQRLEFVVYNNLNINYLIDVNVMIRRISDLASIDSDKRESVKSSDGNVETETTSTRKGIFTSLSFSWMIIMMFV